MTRQIDVAALLATPAGRDEFGRDPSEEPPCECEVCVAAREEDDR